MHNHQAYHTLSCQPSSGYQFGCHHALHWLSKGTQPAQNRPHITNCRPSHNTPYQPSLGYQFDCHHALHWLDKGTQPAQNRPHTPTTGLVTILPINPVWVTSLIATMHCIGWATEPNKHKIGHRPPTAGLINTYSLPPYIPIINKRSSNIGNSSHHHCQWLAANRAGQCLSVVPLSPLSRGQIYAQGVLQKPTVQGEIATHTPHVIPTNKVAMSTRCVH